MKYLAIVLLLVLDVPMILAQPPELAYDTEYWPEITQEAKPWTRWWWMGSAVNETELRHLLKLYAEKGFGGVEITPIYGVRGEEDRYIDFLSPEWMKMLAVTIEAATQNKMGVDMNNGTGWPFGGPHITSEYAAKELLFYSQESSNHDSLQSFLQDLYDSKQGTLLALCGENGQNNP